MKSRMLISVPVWGDTYVDLFCAAGLPAIERAMNKLAVYEGVLVVHTDFGEKIRAGASNIHIDARPVPVGLRDFDCMSQAHRDVINMGCLGDIIVFLTADMIVSNNTFSFCEYRLAQWDKMLLGCAAMRTVREGYIGGSTEPRDLLNWGWDNRHPIVVESTWPLGKIGDLSRVYFAGRDNVAARWCLPHPLAVKKDGRALRFSPTVDANLIENFHPGEVFMVTKPEELAILELSPRDKDFGVTETTMKEKFDDNSIRMGTDMQKFIINHRVVIKGNGADCGDDEYIYRVLKK